jgi:hypothetical protein
MFGRVASQVMSYAAVAGVLIEIPIVSNYAFWVMVGAYLLWIGVNPPRGPNHFKLQLVLTIVLTTAAIVGVFVEIPIVSNFAFWLVAASYVIIVASTDIYRGPPAS